MPTRIQRRRTAGWRMPAHAVYVGRGSKWGNPHRCDPTRAGRADAVRAYRHWLASTTQGQRLADQARVELRGYDLACWCPLNHPCHADVLLAIAGEDTLE